MCLKLSRVHITPVKVCYAAWKTLYKFLNQTQHLPGKTDVTNASAKLVKFYINVQDTSAVIVRKVRSHATYVNYKQP